MTLTVEELFAPFITGADEGRVGPEAVNAVKDKLHTLRDTDPGAFYRLLLSKEFVDMCIRYADAFGVAPSRDPAPDTSREAWVRAVTNEDTDLGYEDWMKVREMDYHVMTADEFFEAHETLEAFDADWEE